MGRHHRNFEFGSWGSDTLTGTDGRDVIFAFGGNDSISSGAGSDLVFAGFGDDTINGGAGNDRIFGGFGFDTAQYAGSIDDYAISTRSWWGPTTVKSVDPSVDDAGRDTLYSVEALYFAEDDYPLFLNGLNNAVLAGDDAVSTAENATLTITTGALLANDQEFDGDTTEITSVSATSAAGATVTLDGGEISYDPGTLFDNLAVGETATDTFTYVVDDGKGGTDTATVTVTVTGENDPVIAGDDTATVSESGVLTVTTAALLANDTDVDGDVLEITAVSATSAAGAVVSLVDGEVIYDPGTIFESLGNGDSATDTFTYSVTDNNGSTVTATVSVTIEGENDAPNLLAVEQICLIEGNSMFQAVIDAEDANGDALSFSLSGADAALFTIDEATGAISFLDAPDLENPLDQEGDNIYDLELTISDGNESTTRNVAVQVVALPPTGGAGSNVIAFDMVGSASLGLLSFVSTAPEFSSAGDGFGLFQAGAGSVPFSLIDDSAAVFPGDSLGIIDSNSNTDVFFGATDTQNADNDGPVSAIWSFDIAGESNLSLSVDVGAMGDFESSDSFVLTYNIDGGSEMVLFEFVADEAATVDYTLAGGGVETLDDPLIVSGTGEVLSNALQTLSAELAGTGSVLNVTLTGSTDGGSEAFALQNLVIEAAASSEPQVVASTLTGDADVNLISFMNNAPTFSSAGDGFGIFQVGTSASIPFSLVDDSAGAFPGDGLGIIDGSSNTDAFFGATDTVNSDTSGPVTATWAFDISGFTDLMLSIDAGAMGDFESSDSFGFTYNIDGGTEMTLFDFVADEAATLDYTLAGGSVETLSDPLTLSGSGEVLSNMLQTLSGSIDGTGSTLNLTFTANTDGGSEAFAFQNIVIEGTSEGGTGEPEPPTYSVSALSEDVFEGDDGVTEVTFEITRDGDVSEAGSIDFAIGGDVDADDFGGVLPAGTVQFAAGQTCATVTLEVTGDMMVEDDETFTVTLDNPVGGDIVTDSASVEVLDDDDRVLISDIQGDGTESELVDQVVTVEAIVTYVTSDGYFLQEEDADNDANAQTSEGIFVFTGGDNQPQVGDLVVTRGVVDEFFGTTQLGQDTMRIVSSGNELPTAASVLLSGAAQDFEAIEGMRFTLDSGIEGENITVVENFNLDRFGEITVSAGVQTQPTQIFDAQTEADEVAALAEENANNRLLIDDGNSEQNPDEFQYIPNTTSGDNGNGFLDAGDTFTETGPTLRLGAEIDGPTTGIMTFGFGEYRMLVDGTLNIDESTNSGAREETAPDVGGDIQVASINVLNYFTTLNGDGGSGPNGLDPRGASTEADLERQTEKLVDAITGTGAEIFALQEIENGGFGSDSAIATLVGALNDDAAATGSGANYAFVDPTADAGFIGTDAITTGIIYDANAVSVVGSEFLAFEESSAATTFALAEVLNAVVPTGSQVGDFQRNRPAVAATFEANETGETFTIVSNHFKSKGPSGLDDLVEAAQDYLDGGGTDITQADIDALVNDPNFDQGDGQGFWNQVRADASAEVQTWIENDYMGGGVSNFIIMGDLNAYAQEDPVQTLTDDPDLVDLIDQFIGQDDAYSFVFDGQRGALDHAIASDDMASLITGAAEWHINADEPDLLNYNSAFNNPNFFEGSLFAASDHDPLIIGIDTNPNDDLLG
ncbi:ExeM/NucH family extracellular endonuclease [uncultured Tateyamaria sp.]|uniref:ExeM/NucH family extracellular endonuclease n=1 Tax=uncultured Tateyamaria sp. TaxID=455651 RepID=UPI0026377043|nr:ExeM/NucH family extracellular endonuclease [uncultured Tateyamaria sp.]